MPEKRTLTASARRVYRRCSVSRIRPRVCGAFLVRNSTLAVIGLVIFSLLVLLLTPAWASETVAIYRRLFHARSLKCTFTLGTQGDWHTGQLKTSAITGEEFVLHFDSIDAKKGTARLIGNVGAGDIVTILTSRGLSFIEETSVGNLNVTTVFPFYKEDTQEFVAVTSRHLLLPGEYGRSPYPSQYHGTCQVWE